MKTTFLFLFIATTSFAQPSISIGKTPILENFQAAMTVESPTDSQIDSIFFLCEAYRDANADSSLLLAQQLLELTKNHPNKNLYAELLIANGAAYLDLGNTDKSQQFLKEALEIGVSTGEKTIIGNVNSLLGNIALGEGNHKNALIHYIAAAKIWEELGKKLSEAKAYKNISTVFGYLDNYPKNKQYLQRVNQIAEDLDNDELRLEVAESKAADLMHYGIKYYLSHDQDSLDLLMREDTLVVYFDKSEKRYSEALVLAKKLDSKEMIIVLLNNMVALALNMENSEKAILLGEEAEILANDLGAMGLMIQAKFNLSGTHHQLGNYNKAGDYGEESLALAKKHGLARKEFLANRILYDLYSEIGNYKRAHEISEWLRNYDAKIGDAERNKAIAEVEAQYQTVQKEKQILELAATNLSITNQRNSILGSAAFLVLLTIFGFRFNKVRNDRNDKMAFTEALIFAQEEERKRIARDLHDGIGQSLLLLKKQLGTTQETTLQSQTMISETLEEVRAISRDLHPFQLDKFGLIASLNEMIHKVEKSTDLFITSEIAEDTDSFFTKKEQIQVYRTIQEALNNVVKHAAATAVQVIIQDNSKAILIKIQDNGIGYDHQLTYLKSKSLGLRTMYERMATIGGKLKTIRRTPNGTAIEISIPKKNNT
ncbi:MAG: signal transduction histidine kinase [Paraglaciecola sp.]|jgi:signal transduction histidine kinase